MARNKVAKWVGLEELEMPEVVAPEVAEAPAETVETQLIEVDGLDRQVEGLIADGNDLLEDADNVEKMEEVVEASVEDGGIDETTADVVEIATESWCGKWGVKRQRIAKENFGDATTRAQATRFALESLNGAKQGLWARFIELIQSIINSAKDMWLSFTNAGKRMHARAVKLEANYKSKGMSGTAKEAQLSGDWVKYCLIDGEADPKALIAFANSSKGTFTSAGAAMDKAAKDLNALVKKQATEIKSTPPSDAPLSMQQPEDSATPVSNGEMSKAMDDAFAAARKTGSQTSDKSGAPQGGMEIEACAYPGNMILTLANVKSGNQMLSILSMDTKESNVDKIAALGPNEIGNAISALKVLSNCMEDHAKSFRYYDAGLKALSDELKTMQKLVQEMDPDSRRAAEAMAKEARQAVLNFETCRRAFKKAQSNGAQGLNGLIRASLNNY